MTAKVRPRNLTARSEHVAKRITEARERLGWTITRLADECARLGAPVLSRMTLSHIETGRPSEGRRHRRPITIDELGYIAKALGVPESALLAEPDCADCGDLPPSGYACLACGKENR